MLTDADAIALATSIKGWTAAKLRRYGIPWPPPTGWRKKLLREYRNRNCAAPSFGRIAKPKPGKPEPNPLELEQAECAHRAAKLTAAWYLRMSGQVPWRPGEKEVLDSQIESENGKWNHIQGRIELALDGQGFPPAL